MSRLIYKEFRQLLPIGWLWLAVILLGYLAKALTSRFDEETFSGWCEGFCDPGTNAFIAVFTILFSLVTAWSLFPREHDESTIDFLRALPVSRPAIYLAKVCAAWLLLCLVNLFSYGLDMTMLSTNPESIGGRFYPQVWFGLLWRDCVFAFVILSHGVVLSWFRTTGLVIYAIYLLLLMIFESQFGTAGLWSVFRILSNEYAGSVLIVDKTAIAVHVLIAILLLLIGYRLWNRSESSRAGGKVSSRGGKLLQGFFVLAGFLVLAAALIYRVGVGTGDVEGGELAVTASGHYRFVYNVADAVSVDYVQTHAEQDLKKLGEILGVTSLPNIRVDLTATSEHAAGLAKWKKIQMDMTSFNENISQRRVLSHESTHVLQAVESDRALSRYFGATRFFIEGMAQYTSFIIVPEQQRRTSNWEIAAVAWDRQNIRFDDLIDDSAFGSRFDPELYYSLGDLWTVALVDTCGQSVLGEFLRAAGRKEAPKGMSATRFWRDTFQHIGCELELVNANWRKQMRTVLESVEPSAFPTFDNIVVTRDATKDIVRIEARVNVDDSHDSGAESTLPDRYLIRVASDTQLAASVDPVSRGQLTSVNVGQDLEWRVVFEVPGIQVPRTRFRYQIGFAPYIDSRYFYAEWQSGSAP